MLLLHQVGSVKIGEVVRYTVAYTPSHDRILPSPEVLHLRIRNTSPIALRAAFVHGPYTLNVCAYPAHFDPNIKFENPTRYGVPEFEPMLKAGGTWSCRLIVPDDIRQTAGAGAAKRDFGYDATGEAPLECASWIVEVSSQVIFSSSAAVGYEILLARDEKSLSLGSVPVIGGQAQVPQPGKVSDFQQSLGSVNGHHPAHPKGIFSRAITLKVEDTASLWNTPQLPGWDDWDHRRPKSSGKDKTVNSATGPMNPEEGSVRRQNPKKVHLVIITHGLHSNLGSDMLYLKESIDTAVRRAKIDAKTRKESEKAKRNSQQNGSDPQIPGQHEGANVQSGDDNEDDDEEVIVRGFSGNATRTEKGIKFLGKRLARYILSITYPDQPFLPSMKKAADSITHVVKDEDGNDDANSKPAHKHSTIHKHHYHGADRKFQITSVSFIGHSLGGLVQTYAIAYIQKHSPRFFDLIKPINFITLASPLLGLSNENPLYVKFALDFGLVGRTGQDLGLTWRAPTIARSGWGALVGTLGESAHKKVMGEVQPESKPLLRILPTGPAHTALKKFRNRTVYSNVVNDGIVPLRTSCLLFLDWQGLDRVEKARREAGLVETVVGFGWAELTGVNVSSRRGPWSPVAEDSSSSSRTDAEDGNGHGDSHEVPQPPSNAIVEDDRRSLNLATPHSETGTTTNSQTNNDSPFSGIFNFFKSSEAPKTANHKTSSHSPRENKIYQRSQTLKVDTATDSASSSRSRVSSGNELNEGHAHEVSGPPRTTFLESAGDLLNPTLPTVEFLIDPSKRPRTIFHDRVYHPSDIPPPPLKKRTGSSFTVRQRSNGRSAPSSPKPGDETSPPSSTPNLGVAHADSTLSTRDYDDRTHTDPGRDVDHVIDSSSMKVEEKIARAYHRDLSWRKVLVKLEPDAHNNIIVRRMFANAFGWPVAKHLADAHFSDSVAARTRDEDEPNVDRAKKTSESPDENGAETSTQKDAQPRENNNGESSGNANSKYDTSIVNKNLERNHLANPKAHERTASEAREATDVVSDLPSTSAKSLALYSSRDSPPQPSYDRADSVYWSDQDFADSEDESEIDMDLVYGRHHKAENARESKGKGTSRASSPGWNWTEKIVGKGAGRKGRKSPQTPLSPVSGTRDGSGDGSRNQQPSSSAT
ncbi:DUF676-domain-containing protein [Xylariaceae sp. FL0662B]|nr:DUF676-domain-containing protein [Xylariaceae sp. FL0662B]